MLREPRPPTMRGTEEDRGAAKEEAAAAGEVLTGTGSKERVLGPGMATLPLGGCCCCDWGVVVVYDLARCLTLAKLK